MKHPRRIPYLVLADSHGNITECPDVLMAGMSAGRFFPLSLEDLIPLPAGSELFVLPGRLPVGYHRTSGQLQQLSEHPVSNGPVQAVAAFMAPAHTMLYNSAFYCQEEAPLLPLFAYTAVGWLDEQFWVAGFRSDPDIRQDSKLIKQQTLLQKTKKRLHEHPGNRLIQHLGKCCLTYGCPAARNYFLDRFEAPLPSSPQCNARCVGCISLQEAGCCRSTQDRITFVPTAQEIATIAVPHLQKAPRAVVSFGQGCEGEPLLQARTLEQSIRLIRKSTPRGTINLNSNASLPDAVAQLATAGLDSLRVSMNSAQEDLYQRYYRPNGYHFADVQASIRVMKKAGKFVSLNYFIQPGHTDSPQELAALCDFLSDLQPDMIQLRNLNMDPQWYFRQLQPSDAGNPMGIRIWLKQVRHSFPQLRFGYFNPCLDPQCHSRR